MLGLTLDKTTRIRVRKSSDITLYTYTLTFGNRQKRGVFGNVLIYNSQEVVVAMSPNVGVIVGSFEEPVDVLVAEQQVLEEVDTLSDLQFLLHVDKACGESGVDSTLTLERLVDLLKEVLRNKFPFQFFFEVTGFENVPLFFERIVSRIENEEGADGVPPIVQGFVARKERNLVDFGFVHQETRRHFNIPQVHLVVQLQIRTRFEKLIQNEEVLFLCLEDPIRVLFGF
jgi:hypothetical protein